MQNSENNKTRTSIHQLESSIGFFNDKQKCLICNQAKYLKKNVYFAECLHQGFCLKCTEGHLLSSIKEKMYPRCLMGSHCKEKMRTDENGLLNYYSQRTQAKWKEFYDQYRKQRRETFEQITNPCKVPDCKGVIECFRCTKCGEYYCEKCRNFDHPYLSSCRFSEQQIWISQVQECPNCKTPYVKEEGCKHITCINPKCKFQFCESCHGPWSLAHHACFKLQNKASFETADTSTKQIKKQKVRGCCAIF